MTTPETYTMNTYLEESALTAHRGDKEPYNLKPVFDNDMQVLWQMMDVVYMGHSADAIKRVLFYADPKIEERMANNKKSMSETFEKLRLIENTVKLSPEKIDLIHAVLGLASEAGEIAEEIIASIIEDRDVNTENLTEEAGDTSWYLAMLLRKIKKTFEGVAFLNIEKLKKRYPAKFNIGDAVQRDVESEKKVFSGQ